MVYDGLQRRWVSDTNQWANQDVRTSLAAVHEVVAGRRGRPERPARELPRHQRPHRDEHRVRLGQDLDQRLPHRPARRRAPNGPSPTSARSTTSSRADRRRRPPAAPGTTTSRGSTSARRSAATTRIASPAIEKKPADFMPRFQQFPEAPVVFLIGQYYVQGLCNGVPSCTTEEREAARRRPRRTRLPIGPDVWVLNGSFSGGTGERDARPVHAAGRRRRSRPRRRRTRSRPSSQTTPARSPTSATTSSCSSILALLLIMPGLARVVAGSGCAPRSTGSR